MEEGASDPKGERSKAAATEMDREAYYAKLNWPDGGEYQTWIQLHWMTIDGELLALVQFHRTLMQVQFLLGVKDDHRVTEVEAFISKLRGEYYTRAGVKTLLQTHITFMLDPLSALMYESGIDGQDGGKLLMTGDKLFETLVVEQWKDLEDGTLAFLKLCSAIDDLLRTAGVAYLVRQRLTEGVTIKRVTDAIRLAESQMCALETRVLCIRIALRRKQLAEKGSNTEEDGCQLQ